MNQIAKGFHISTRTVHNLIKRNRRTMPWTFGYDQRRLPRANRCRLIEVKISGVFRALIAWLIVYDQYGTFDLEAVMRAEKPP